MNDAKPTPAVALPTPTTDRLLRQIKSNVDPVFKLEQVTELCRAFERACQIYRGEEATRPARKGAKL